MSAILRDLADARAVADAIEANAASFLMALGRAGGGEERRSEAIEWVIGGSPIDYHNCVVRSQMSDAHAKEAIDEVVERLGSYGVPGTWHLGPSSTPSDLAKRLLRRGFTYGGSEPGMAAEMSALESPPPHLEVRRVETTAQLNAWASTLATGFGEGEREASWVRDVYATIGLDRDSAFHHYLGFSGGRPVSTASAYYASGVAGLYFVMTTPDERRRGYGAAITRAAMRDAEASGYRVAVLQSSEMGRSLYEGMGFREFCRFDLYEWRG